ncbi:MAG: DNA polymerase I [Muribaculaceae bacterium]|nr:DNA polymerase I [Muribaculaceae bacterium]
MKKLFLLDAYALIFRAYYALIKMPRITQTGFNTSAIFGFVNTLEELLRKENPTHIAVCFDPQGPTFRNEAYEGYKAERSATPEDIKLSIPFIKEIVKAYNIPIVEVEGFEADDVIGTLAKKAEKEDFVTYMMTPDKDFGQLVSPSILQYKPSYRGQDFELRGEKEVCERYGIERTEQVIDLLALMGDKIDNIPGCPGVGEKTAVKLISDFGNIDNLLRNTDSLKGALKKKVEENKEQIEFSRFLATIRTDAPVEITPDQLKRQPVDRSKLFAIFDELEFRSLARRVARRLDEGIGTVSPSESANADKTGHRQDSPSPAAPSLFDNLDLNEEPTASTATPPQQMDMANLDYATIREGNALDALQRRLLPDADCGIYLLADGENDATSEWIGTAVALPDGYARFIPADYAEGSAAILDLLARGDIRKVSVNAKRDYVIAARHRNDDADALRNFYDISLAHYLLQPEMRHTLEALAPTYLGVEGTPFPSKTTTSRRGKKSTLSLAADMEEIGLWACRQADMSLRLAPILEKEIETHDFGPLLRDVEMPLVRVLADMELTGVRIDTKALRQAEEDMMKRLEALEKDIFALAGMEFNVSSPAKVGEVLFDVLALDPKAKKTKTGQYSTSEDVLEKLMPKHPIVAKIMEYRALKKLLTTYLTALPAAINPATGRVHTNYNQTVTATGRLSSSAPNLQNIPVRDDEGREIRRAFIAEPGCLFLSADYSQIELRLLADFSNDPIMIDAFRHGKDIHGITASKIYHKTLGEVTENERRNAKTANFGIVYGISAFGLSTRLGIPRGEAKDIIDNYFATFPTVRKYMADSVEKAREHGYVETRMGRRRLLPDINSRNPVVRGYAERNAINAPLQGTAADIIKIAMIRIADEIRERGLKSKMIMQVHDELNFNVPENEVGIMQELVSRRMQEAYSGKVVLTASSGVATNWLDAH